jgi:hypothetical protein
MCTHTHLTPYFFLANQNHTSHRVRLFCLYRTNVRVKIKIGDDMGNYGIMLTRQVTDIKGKILTEVQCFDFKRGGIWRFTLDKIDSDELPQDLKVFIKKNLTKIQDGRWNYTGKHSK